MPVPLLDKQAGVELTALQLVLDQIVVDDHKDKAKAADRDATAVAQHRCRLAKSTRGGVSVFHVRSTSAVVVLAFAIVVRSVTTVTFVILILIVAFVVVVVVVVVVAAQVVQALVDECAVHAVVDELVGVGRVVVEDARVMLGHAVLDAVIKRTMMVAIVTTTVVMLVVIGSVPDDEWMLIESNVDAFAATDCARSLGHGER